MDEQTLLTYLQLHYWTRDDIQIHNLRNITTGWETEILSFNLEWAENGERELQRLVARIYPGKNAAIKAQREATTMKRLLELGYPVPVVQIVETEKSHLGQPFMIMDRIDGGTLDDKLHENEDKWMKEFSILFVNLHRLDWKKMQGTTGYSPNDDPYYYIKTILSGYEKDLEHSQKHELYPIISWLQKRIDDVPCKSPSIVHGDFHPFNILVDENDKAFVIDWGASKITDFRSDLAWTLLLHYAYSTQENRDATLRNYETTLGQDVEQIEYFEVLATLRRLYDVTSSFDKGAGELGMRPEALELMRETIGHIVRVKDRLEDLTEITIPEIEQFIQKLSE
ncbi:MAG: phosphotransferase [Candidatus Thorarchaeota archaeon]|nr:phosphotransferase [Candidatus Thorarchaeota archaeon]